MTTRDPYPTTPPASTAPPSSRSATAGPGQPAGSFSPPGTADQVKETAGQTLEQTKEKTGQLVEQATAQAKPRLEDQKQRAADSLGTTAQALRQTSQQLRDQDEGPVAQVAERAADQVERIADYLREKDIGQLVSEAENFARRQPTLFLGGAFALGLLGARFFKSSGQQVSQGGGSQGHAQGMGAGARQSPQPTGYRPELAATSELAPLPKTPAGAPAPAAPPPPLSAEGVLAEPPPLDDPVVRPGYAPEREAR